MCIKLYIEKVIMNQIKTGRLLFVLILASVIIGGITYLRFERLIESQDYSFLIISILIGSFLIIFLEKISEVSIIGNTVKLQQINDKSEELLKQLRLEHFKLRIESAFGANNFFGGGDSVITCRAKLYQVAKDIKDAELVENEELRNKILPLLKLHAGKHLELVQRYGANLEANPLVSDDPEEMTKVITDEFVNSAKINGITSNIEKYKEIINNINLYQNLLNASKWFEK